MFKSGAKQFWQTACVTTSIGNPHTLGGWTITPADGGKLCIAWTDADGNTLGPGGLSSGPRFGARA